MPSLSNLTTANFALPSTALYLLGIIVTYAVYLSLYNVFFHPLRRFPGPKAAAVTRFYYDYISLKGRQAAKTLEWHEKYGEIVRITPNQLSFTNEQAWKDIYMHQQGRVQLQKVPLLPVKDRAPDLVTSSDDVHARQRKMVSHAFSDRNLRDQEPMLKTYVDMLIRNLQKDAQEGKATDIVREYNFTTFDIIGDFAFGEPFHMLETRSQHPFIKLLFMGTRLLTKITAVANSLNLLGLVKILTAVGENFAPFNPMEWVHEKVASRIASGEQTRPDLFTNILRAKKEYGDLMPTEEIDSVAATLLAAGSETTATLLSGLTNYLLTHRDWLRKLTAEIRNEFNSVDDITIMRLARLPILQACVEEALRCYPPVPVVMARITPPGGTMICGHFIPEQTIVGVAFYASQNVKTNFARPLEFHPERFMPDAPKEFANDHRGSLMPFSAGPRNCVGKNLAIAEIKLILGRVLYQFDMRHAEPEKTWRTQNVWTLWDKPPLWVTLSDRLD